MPAALNAHRAFIHSRGRSNPFRIRVKPRAAQWAALGFGLPGGIRTHGLPLRSANQGLFNGHSVSRFSS